MKKYHESVITIIFNEGKVLLVKRRDVPLWTLPGGRIDDGETPESAAIREICEETGLNTKIKRKIGLYHPTNWLTKKTYFFECEIIDGTFQLGSETAGLKFFDIDNLPYELPPPHPEWINDALNKTDYFEKTIESVTNLTFLKHLILHPVLVGKFLITKCKSLNS